jgi:addiction module HigA family antidote
MSAKIRGKAAADERAGALSPGEHLRAEIKRLALNQVVVSKAAGVSRQSINNIINGRQPISRAMAGKLARLTGRDSDYWLHESFPAMQSGSRPGEAGKARSLAVGILVDHQIEQAVKDGTIRVEPFTAENVQTASLTLTLDRFGVTTGGERIDIGRGKGFILDAGHAVNFSSRERIALPRGYLGRPGALGRLAEAGIVASHAFQIEPGFDGHLHVLLFNASRQRFRLKPGDAVMGLEIIRLAAATEDE